MLKARPQGPPKRSPRTTSNASALLIGSCVVLSIAIGWLQAARAGLAPDTAHPPTR